MDLVFEILSESAADTESAGKNLARLLTDREGDLPNFIAMYGGLGAGKTAFVRGLASVLTPESHVTSPTYAILNVYEGNSCTLYHLDLYRITGEDDLYSVGFDELFGANPYPKKVVIAAEWCENIPGSLPDRYISVTFGKSGENKRLIRAAIIDRG